MVCLELVNFISKGVVVIKFNVLIYLVYNLIVVKFVNIEVVCELIVRELYIDNVYVFWIVYWKW